MRPNMQEVIERANLIDGDLLAGFLLAGRFRRFALLLGQRIGLQQTKVGMISLRQPTASRTTPARFFPGRRLLAEQRFGEAAREIELADAALPRQQKCMRQLRPAQLKLSPDIPMQVNDIHKQILKTLSSTCFLISSKD